MTCLHDIETCLPIVDLEPCPHCGSMPALRNASYWLDDPARADEVWFVVCETCGHNTGIFGSGLVGDGMTSAVRFWNEHHGMDFKYCKNPKCHSTIGRNYRFCPWCGGAQ